MAHSPGLGRDEELDSTAWTGDAQKVTDGSPGADDETRGTHN